MALSSLYERDTEYENTLLCEFYLRQVYFHLIDAIQDPCRGKIFRRVCLDAIHTPLLCLKRYYQLKTAIKVSTTTTKLAAYSHAA